MSGKLSASLVAQERKLGIDLTALHTAMKRTGAEDGAVWLSHEIQGYPDNTEVPGYRVTRGRIVGDFLIPGQLHGQNHDLTELLPEEQMEQATKAVWTESIDTLSEINTSHTVDRSIHGMVNTVLNAREGILKLNPGVSVMNARLRTSPADVTQIVSKVRMAALHICLELEKKGLEPMKDGEVRGQSERAKEAMEEVWRQIVSKVPVVADAMAWIARNRYLFVGE